MPKTGPVADKVRDVQANTMSDFQNLADARTTPSEPAATGQPLTHYHSMFYSLLSVGLDIAVAIGADKLM